MARPVPADLEDALAADPTARERFWSLPPERVDEWVGWVESARFPGVRRRRVAQTVARLGGRNGRVATATVVEDRGPMWIAWVLGLVLVAGIAALVLWFAVYRHHHSGHSAVVVTATSTVPKVTGIRVQAAQFQLNEKKLGSTITRRRGAKPKGIVLSQAPRAGSKVRQGSAVTLVVSTGPPGIAMPNLKGLSAADAANRLQAAKVTVQLKQVASTEPPGTVVGQTPPAGKRAVPGSTVVLQVAKGKATVAVPDLHGQTSQAAQSALSSAGLKANVVQVPSSQQQGTVVAQRPAAGTKVAQGASVRLNVAKGAPQTTTQQQTTTAAATTTQQQVTTQQVTTTAAPNVPKGNDYRGMQLQAAAQKIAQGRQQVIVTYARSTRPAGIVIANSTTGSREHLTVSAGDTPGPAVNVPDETGLDPSTAQTDLGSVGFTVIQVQWPVSDPAKDGTVVAQTPATQAPHGSAIVLYVGAAA
jgi:beta-lactam-binding protein with PASTA domain